MSSTMPDFDDLMDHEDDDVVRVSGLARDMAHHIFIPAITAWEHAHHMPRCSLALHGAAELLKVVLDEGVPREEIEIALSGLLAELDEDNT